VVGSVLSGADDPLRLLVTVTAFVGLWIVGLVLIGVVCAWRAAVWTLAEVAREGTFGGFGDRRPGHWRLARSSATLWPGRLLGRSRRRGER
jgi:apolipoprotein N-acyltransferase